MWVGPTLCWMNPGPDNMFCLNLFCIWLCELDPLYVDWTRVQMISFEFVLKRVMWVEPALCWINLCPLDMFYLNWFWIGLCEWDPTWVECIQMMMMMSRLTLFWMKSGLMMNPGIINEPGSRWYVLFEFVLYDSTIWMNPGPYEMFFWVCSV